MIIIFLLIFTTEKGMSRWVLGCGCFQYKIKTMTSGVTYSYATHKKCQVNTVLKNTNNCAHANPFPQPPPHILKVQVVKCRNTYRVFKKSVFITMCITPHTSTSTHCTESHRLSCQGKEVSSEKLKWMNGVFLLKTGILLVCPMPISFHEDFLLHSNP